MKKMLILFLVCISMICLFGCSNVENENDKDEINNETDNKKDEINNETDNEKDKKDETSTDNIDLSHDYSDIPEPINNINVTDIYKNYEVPEYSEKTKDYLSKIYKNGEFLADVITVKPKNILDYNFSGNLDNKKDASSYSVEILLPKICRSIGGNEFTHDGSRGFCIAQNLFEVSADFDVDIDEIYLLNNGINKYSNEYYIKGNTIDDGSGNDYIVVFGPSYFESGFNIYMKLTDTKNNKFFVVRVHYELPFTEYDTLDKVLKSIKLKVE